MKLELTKTQLENIENKSMLVLPVSSYMMSKDYIYNPDEMLTTKEEFANTYLPIKKGDKNVWIAEEFFYIEQTKEYLFKDMFWNGKITLNETYDINDFNWQQASEMTKEQSRHTISEILDVKVVRVQDINNFYALKLLGKTHLTIHNNKAVHNKYKDHYNQILKEHNIDRRYEDNDYVFLVEYRHD